MHKPYSLSLEINGLCVGWRASILQYLRETSVISVGTGGARGARPPQYINQGGPGPPNVGAIKDILTVKLDFLIHIPVIFATIF